MFPALERPEEGTPGKVTLLEPDWAQYNPEGEKRGKFWKKGSGDSHYLLLFLSSWPKGHG